MGRLEAAPRGVCSVGYTLCSRGQNNTDASGDVVRTDGPQPIQNAYPSGVVAIIMAALLTTSLSSTVSAAEGKRVAFVVGINKYENLGKDRQLERAVNDAREVSRTLRKIGFQVTEGIDVTTSEFDSKWQNVLNSLTEEDTFVLFFSGHGVEVDGENLLLPRDIPYFKFGRHRQFKRQAVSVSELMNDLRTGDHQHPKVTVMILDACRENPTIPPEYRTKGGKRKGGLAAINKTGGMFILYAAAPGTVSLDRLGPDDTDPNSVYTRSLLPLLNQANLSIQDLAIKVRERVHDLTETEQIPEYTDGLIGPFCFAGCVGKLHAEQLRNQVISQRLSAEARNHLDKQLDLALLLSIEAYKRAKTTEALQSLYTSLDSAGSSIFLYGRPDDGYGLTFSKDNKLLASGSRWGWLQIWDMNSTPPRSIRLQGHGEHIYNLAVSPTNQTVVSNDEKGNVVLWDLSQTPPHPRLLQQHNKYVGTLLSYSSDGSLLASGDSNGTLLLYTLSSSTERVVDLKGHTNPIIKLMFTPDGKTMISGDSAGTFLLWDLGSMPPTQRRRLVVGEGDLQTRTVSPDGKLLAISDSKGHLWVWDLTVDQPRPIPLPGYEGVVNALAFSPNRKKLVAGDKKGTLLVWDLMVEPPRSIPLSTPTNNGFTHGVHKVAFSPNGTTIVATTGAGYGGFHLWDLKFNPPRTHFHSGHRDVVEKLIFSPDGKHLVSADNHGTYLIWHFHNGLAMSRTIPGHQNGVVDVAFTTDGQAIGLVDSVGTSMIWKIDEPSSIQSHLHGQRQAGFEQINFSDDWTKLSAKSGNRPFLLDRTFNPPRSIFIPTPPGGVGTLRLSPDGTRLAVGGRDNITLWNLTSLPPTSISLPSHGHNEYVRRLQFSSDSKLLASSDGRDVLLWNLNDPSFPKPFRADHKGRAGNFAFSPDNKHLASGGANGTLLLWDLSTVPPQLRSLPGHATEKDHYVNSVLFSPDGQHLVSGDSSTNLILWNLKSGKPLATPLPANRRRRLAAFNPKSDTLVIDKDYNSLSLFDLTGDLSSPISLSEHKDTVRDIAFSPNGTFISTELYGTVLTWDLESSPPRPAQLWTYQGPTRGSASGPDPFIFSSTGSALAVSVGNVLLLGDLTVNPPRSIQLSSNEAFVKAYAFSPDEKTLLGTYGKEVVFWNVDFDSWVDHACRIANRNFTQREWSHFLPDEPYRLTCKSLQPSP